MHHPPPLQRFGESTARRLERVAVLDALASAPGANLAATTAAGLNILHLLAEKLSDTARPELLELAGRLLRQALAAGVSIDAAAGDRGWTPLHTAAACCSPFGRLLVEAEADVK